MANVRIEWVLLEPETDVIIEIFGAIDEFVEGHKRFSIPDGFKPRRHGNRIAVRLVQATGDIYLRSTGINDPDVTTTTGMKYMGGFEAHRNLAGIEASLILVEPGEQLSVLSPIHE